MHCSRQHIHSPACPTSRENTLLTQCQCTNAEIQDPSSESSTGTMALRSLARLYRSAQLGSSEGSLLSICTPTLALRAPGTDLAVPSKPLLSWLQSCRDSLWLAAPKRKVGLSIQRRSDNGGAHLAQSAVLLQVSPHRRGMRNAGKHQKMVPVVSRCK